MNELFDTTPSDDPSARLRLELTEDFDLACARLEAQMRTAPARMSHALATAGIAPEVVTDGVLPHFVRSLEPVMEAFVSVIATLDRVYDASWEADPDPVTVSAAVDDFKDATSAAVLVTAEASAAFRLRVATATELPAATIAGPVAAAFDGAYVPVVQAAIEMVDGALGVGAGLQAHIEASALPDTVPEDWAA